MTRGGGEKKVKRLEVITTSLKKRDVHRIEGEVAYALEKITEESI